MKHLALVTALSYLILTSIAVSSTGEDSGIRSRSSSPISDLDPTSPWMPISKNVMALRNLVEHEEYLTRHKAVTRALDAEFAKVATDGRSVQDEVAQREASELDLRRINLATEKIDLQLEERAAILRRLNIEDSPRSIQQKVEYYTARVAELEALEGQRSADQQQQLQNIQQNILPLLRLDTQAIQATKGELVVRKENIERSPVRHASNCRLELHKGSMADLCAVKAETQMRLGTGFTNKQLFSANEFLTQLFMLGVAPNKHGDKFSKPVYPHFLRIVTLPILFKDESNDPKTTLTQLKVNTARLLLEAKEQVKARSQDFILIFRRGGNWQERAFNQFGRDEAQDSAFTNFAKGITWSNSKSFNVEYLFEDNQELSQRLQIDTVSNTLARMLSTNQATHKNGLRLVYDTIFTTGSVSDFNERKVLPGLNAAVTFSIEQVGSLNSLYDSLKYLLRAQMMVSTLETVSNNISTALLNLNTSEDTAKYQVKDFFG